MFNGGRGVGGGGYFYTGKLRFKVQPLSISYTIFSPLSYTFY